jgi:peroxiredoxin Q/BCP
MKAITLNERIGPMPFESTDPTIGSFADLQGKNIVLYFYPKDSTPGCTIEGRDFSALNANFQSLNTQILGVSRDSIASHQKFCQKQGFVFPLISDPDEVLCQYFNVIVKKNMFKRLIIGIERSTFLIDSKGMLCKEWRTVNVKIHANEVLQAVQDLEKIKV